MTGSDRIQHRLEIDGLRALAILPVIFFHAHVFGYDSGFAGVDVFFVISGYLITGILCADMALGRFSILNFYERRARRLLPALLLVVGLSFPCAWLLMPPTDFDGFAKSVGSVAVFASNLFFWNQSSYFAQDADFSPLLHTWSLSIEEQFYVVFPIALWAIWRFGASVRMATFIILAVGSFAVCVWASYLHPTANFYLIPTRAWELLVGVVLGLTTRKVVGGQTSNVLSMLGLLGVMCSMIFLHEHSRFPGMLALVPTIGTALVIYFATDGTMANKILVHPILVRIGLVSYSAYLFHYPVFVFARFYLGHTPDTAQSVLLIGVIFGFAQLSWHLVEQPFRNRHLLSRRAVLASAFAALATIGSASLLLDRFDGFASARYGAQPVALVRYYEDLHANGLAEAYHAECDFLDWSNDTPRSAIDAKCTQAPAGKPVAFLWGDSHAQALSFGLRQILSDKMFVAQVATSGCPPTLDGSLADDTRVCARSTAFALSEIKRLRPRIVVMAQRYRHEMTDWREITSWLEEAGVDRIVLVGPTPQWEPTLAATIAFHARAVRGDRAARFDESIAATDTLLRQEMKGPDWPHYVSLMNKLCDTETCKYKLTAGTDHDFLVVDYGHLSPIGSEYVVGLVARQITGS